MIEESSQNIHQLIEEFLKLSRITKQEIVRSEIDLSTLAEEILKNLSQQSSDRVVEWKIEPEIIINADLNLVRIMLSNLLDNAWKYSKNQDRAVIEMGLTQRE
jgi:signal transduction histidine kinase